METNDKKGYEIYIEDLLLRMRYEEEISIEELADILNVSKSDIVLAIDSKYYPTSLNEVIYEKDGSVITVEERLVEKESYSLIDKITLYEEINKLTEKERATRNHARDNLLTFKSPLKNVKQIEISMFNLELPCYYSATIDTTYGELEIIIPRKIVSIYGKKLKDGLIIKGELLLSGSIINNKTK